MFKKILTGLLVVLVLIQFYPRTVNKSDKAMPNDINGKYQIPDNLLATLKTACYDCHSNNTHYPWYSAIQPFRFFLDKHVREGKEELNFNEFASYSEKKQFNKLRAIGESLKQETMPLKSYLLFHSEAKLTKPQKDSIISWVNATRDFIKSQKDK